MKLQMALPVEVRPDEVARKQTFGAAIALCTELERENRLLREEVMVWRRAHQLRID